MFGCHGNHFAISDLRLSYKHFTIGALEDKLFNPFDLNDGKSIMPLDEVDSDCSDC